MHINYIHKCEYDNPSLKQEISAMTANVGNIDRILRIAAGLALLAFAFFSGSTYAWLGYIGVVPLATALFRWCPAYTLIGVSTCPVARK
jgi:hypothetical protein